MLAQRYPGVMVVASESNLGFAGGADLGMDNFAGAFIALLNNDATFAVDAIERMISVLEQPGNERVGAVTAKILLTGTYRLERGLTEATAPTGSFRRDDGWLVPADPGSPGAIGVVNSTGSVVTRQGAGRDRDWLSTEGEESRDAEVFGFCGGAALLRGGAGRGRRVRSRALPLLRGHRPVVAPARWRVDGPILRAGGRPPPACGQLGQRSPLFRYYNTRNSLVVFARHAPVAVVVSSFGRQLVGGMLAVLQRSEPPSVRRARIRGLTAFVRRLPRTRRERARWRTADVSRAEVARFLS